METTDTTQPPVTGAPAPNGAPPPAPAAALPVEPDMPAVESSGGAIAVYASQKNFELAQRIARSLASSSLVPTAYQGNIPNTLIAMELSSRIGASVLMVMQNLDIIHGRPSWRSQFLIATVNASKRFTPLRFRFVGKEGSDDWGCRAVARDKETNEECIGACITIRMVKAEGWFDRKGSKWVTMPEHMLFFRAAAFWARVYAPELSLGIQTTEEVIDTTGYDSTNAQIPAAPAPMDIAPSTTKDLEAALRSQKPPSVPPPAATPTPQPTPSTTATTDPSIITIMQPVECLVCAETFTGDGVAMIRASDEKRGYRHAKPCR